MSLPDSAADWRRTWSTNEAFTIRPPMLTVAAHDALSPEARKAYDRQRIRFMGRYRRYRTRDYFTVRGALHAVMATSVPPGAIPASLTVTGPPITGLTHLSMHTAREAEHALALTDPDATTEGHARVFRVNVPIPATPRGVYLSVMHGLDAPFSSRITQAQARDRAIDLLTRAGTRLLLIDGIEMLWQPERKAHLASAAAYDDLARSTGVTLVYIGYDAAATALTNGQGSRKRARFNTTVTLANYQLDYPFDPFDVGEWRHLVTLLDEDVPLLRHAPGSLTRVADALGRRCQGNVHALIAWAVGAVVAAIMSGDEKITDERLDAFLSSEPDVRGEAEARDGVKRGMG